MKLHHVANLAASAVLGVLLLACTHDDGNGTKFGDPPPREPFISSFAPAKPAVTKGAGATLLATFQAGIGTIDHGVGKVVSGQAVAVNPDEDTTYTLSVVGATGSIVKSTATVFILKGVFSTTGSMGSGRSEHRATLLPSGEVLVCGGWTSSTLGGASEIYDPLKGTFRLTRPPVTSQYFCTATLLRDGKVLLTGADGNELYDPASDSFSLTGASVHPRDRATAVLLKDGRVLLCGGPDKDSDSITNAEIYDPVAGTFKATGSMIVSRSGHTATLLPNGKVLIVGGCSDAMAELFDPSTGSFSGTGSLGLESWVQNTATLLPSGQVLVLEHFWKRTGSNWIRCVIGKAYDPSTETFRTIGTPHTWDGRFNWEMSQAGTMLPSGWILFTGCAVLNDVYATAVLYNPSTGVFKNTGEMAYYRISATATLLASGKVLVVGGYGDAIGAELYDSETFVH